MQKTPLAMAGLLNFYDLKRNPLWERACSRRRLHIQRWCWL